jgi:DNA-binding beta-propeller fold protein YncE
VVVNDTTAARVRDQVGLGDPNTSELLAVLPDEEHDRVFVVDAENFLLFNLRPGDLTERWRLDLPGQRFPGGFQLTEGIALSGDILYVDIGDSLVAVDVERQLVLGTVADAHWGQHVHLRQDGTLYVGGYGGLGVVDPRTGATKRSLEIDDFGGTHFALSPDGRLVALLLWGPEPTLVILDGESLAELRRASLGDIGFPVAVAFHPAGKKAYVFSEGSEWRLLVIEVSSARVLKDIVIARGRENFLHGLAPAERSNDGRFVVFPSPKGTFFVDTAIDHPRYRSVEASPVDSYGCCSIAGSKREPAYYLTDRGRGTVSRLRLTR